jgi:hypothetical protein
MLEIKDQQFFNLGIYTLSQESHRLDGEILLKGCAEAPFRRVNLRMGSIHKTAIVNAMNCRLR